MIMILI